MHIKNISFTVGGHVLLYDRKLLKFPGKLQMHWLGYFIIVEVKESRVIKLAQLDGVLLPGWVNGAWLKPFQGLNNSTQN